MTTMSRSGDNPQISPVLVSVVIITYNHAPYIAQAIESVLAQKTNFRFEVLIGEDDSSDGTREIVSQFAQLHPEKIKAFLRSRRDVIYINGRPTGRWNYFETISQARGKYVAVLEGDDFWTDSDKLQQQADFLEAHPEYFMCAHWVINVDDKGDMLQRQGFTGKGCPKSFTQKNALCGIPVHQNSWLFRNFDLKAHKAFPLLQKVAAADDPMILVLLGMGPGYLIQKPMSAYRIHSGGTWSTKSLYRRRFEMLLQCYMALRLAQPRYFLAIYHSIGSRALGLFLATCKDVCYADRRPQIAEVYGLIKTQNVLPRREMLILLLIALTSLPFVLILALPRRLLRIARSRIGL